MGGIGPIGIILIVLVALLLFGPSKLPELGRAFGRTLKEFKRGTKDLMEEEDEQKARREVNETAEQRLESRKAEEDKNDNKRLPD